MFTKVAENLKNLGYQVAVFDTKEQAADYLDGTINDKTVGFGGSVTLAEMGLYDKLKTHNTVSWHLALTEGSSVLQMRRKRHSAKAFYLWH